MFASVLREDDLFLALRESPTFTAGYISQRGLIISPADEGNFSVFSHDENFVALWREVSGGYFPFQVSKTEAPVLDGYPVKIVTQLSPFDVLEILVKMSRTLPLYMGHFRTKAWEWSEIEAGLITLTIYSNSPQECLALQVVLRQRFSSLRFAVVQK